MLRIQRFIPGRRLNSIFFKTIVKPLMGEHFPNLKYSVGLLGNGSDVYGYDDPTSTDHNWGPRLVMFLPAYNFKKRKSEVDQMLRNNLPHQFMGYSVNFTKSDKEAYLKTHMSYQNSGKVNHLISFYTINTFFGYYLGFEPKRKKLTYKDWLTFPQQALIEVTSGEVYYDGLGELNKMRKKFEYYPRDIWIYMMRNAWGRIGDELSFQARAGETGDKLGSHILATRMVQEIIKLAFIMEKVYIPYEKWFGVAFAHLKCYKDLGPILLKVEKSDSWKKRQKLISQAYVVLAKVHNALNITKPLSTEISDFHGRGYTILEVKTYVRELDKKIKNRKLRRMKFPLGAIDQFVDHNKLAHLEYAHREFRHLIR